MLGSILDKINGGVEDFLKKYKNDSSVSNDKSSSIPTRESASGYNGSTDFLKWYKGMYGSDYDETAGLVRKEGMSDGDWDVGSILHNYYIKDQKNEAEREKNVNQINTRYDTMIDNARAGFDSSRRTLTENKETAQQNANIIYQKLQKYLPMKQQAQGLGGLGTQSAGLDAYNRYMSQMGGIASDYQGNMRAIDDSETETISELERYRSDSLEENDSLHDSLARTYGNNADSEAKAAWKGYLQGEKQRRDEAYSMARSVIAESTSEDLDNLMTYVNGLKGKVSDEQFASLSDFAKSVAATNQKKVTDERTNKQNSEYANAYNMALGVLQSATTEDANELNAYVNGLEGKVNSEQLASLRQIAKNVAAANSKNNNKVDNGNASQIVETVLSGMIDNGDYKGAQEYLDNNKEILGGTTTDAYQGVIDMGNNAIQKETDEKKQAEKDAKIISGEESISYDGNKYKLDGKTIDFSKNLLTRNDKTLESLGFDDPYDPDIPNGMTISIKDPFKIGGIWGSNNVLYVTKYNDKWYLSKKQ